MSRRQHPFVSNLLAPVQFSRSRNQILESIFYNGLPYSRKLSAHTSCVNYLAFSSNGARFLASGGDDLDIQIWDFHQDNISHPCHTCVGHTRNIFTMTFSASNKYLFSGGTDNMIHKFDATQFHLPRSPDAERPLDSLSYRNTIRSLSCHPFQDEVFLSASESGRIILHDERTWRNPSTRARDIIQVETEVCDVKFHPTMANVFASCDSKGTVCLRDVRLGFGPANKRMNQGVVQVFNTKISKGSIAHLSNPESSSITFDRDGTKLAVTMLHHYPTIYSVSDPNPIALCNVQTLPDGSPVLPGQRTYSNSCTIKHGSFGGLGFDSDDFYCAGSDDFCAYLWKIPSISSLVERRQVVDPDEWSGNPVFADTTGYASGLHEPRYVPVNIKTPLCRLTGHNSIVNTTLVHPDFPYIVTCGIERHIFLHSATPSTPFSDGLESTPTEVRSLLEQSTHEEDIDVHNLLIGVEPVDSGDLESSTISLFDGILRAEGAADPFQIRRWLPDSDSESEDESSD
ncbi:WD40 repeat-like protein [Guyanagaster necrorhizus]|uniref:WD40 repeat-like protein n=1 Tax=Guyanagaster necrorhizus TaxID=856835 RepID=A0A9P7VQR9_9AGAR|nr:WD40 repeat-like protein [Guyanagaster necrorhizus MCA 3950]KAG7445711.1 WD40 repeat-like protein [Guyanagaster necrorhizus MCA 3950]